MSSVKICDGGCDFSSSDESEFESIGVIHPNDYCVTCAVKARKYLAELDSLQEILQLEWSEGLTAIQSKADLETLPNDCV